MANLARVPTISKQQTSSSKRKTYEDSKSVPIPYSTSELTRNILFCYLLRRPIDIVPGHLPHTPQFAYFFPLEISGGTDPRSADPARHGC
jgi:hypothetical protein